MRAEELIALAAAARGVDLVQAAGQTLPEQKRQTQRVRGVLGWYDVPLEPTGLEARGRGSDRVDRPSWTVAELGHAAKGVPQLYFWAACYAYAGDQSVRWQLHEALTYTAMSLRTQNNWPHQVRGAGNEPAHFYLAELADLVLLEDLRPRLFTSLPGAGGTPALYWIYMRVEEQTWRKSLFEKFDALKVTWLGWIDRAMRTMQPRLSEHEEEPDS